jgi:signal transduction histidine kinase
MAVLRRPVRSRPIRLFLLTMFAVPLVSLVGLWAFAASVTVPGAIKDHNYSVNSVALTSPTVATLTTTLPTEQAETYIWLLSERKAPKASLLATRKVITQVLPSAEALLLTGQNLLSASSKADLNTLETDLRHIPSLRQSVDAGTISATGAFQGYSNIIDAQFQSYYSSTLDRGGSLQAIAVGATDSALALEMVSRESTLVNGALAVDKGTLDPAARQLFISSAAQRQFLLSQTLSLLTPDLRGAYVTLVNSAVYKQFEAMESQVIASTGPLQVDATTWNATSGAVLGAMLKAQTDNGSKLAAKSNAASNGLYTEAILAGGLGLLAVVISVLLLLWFGRRVTGDLTRLYSSVREMADERLPRVVERLRRGDDVDVHAESPPPSSSSINEISAIATSFATVQGAAVAAAVEQARLRKGVNQVFLNISMRNQSLLHRQLGMLDGMERRTSEPGALADLFRLDHLTTRMRRHAEGLIILSGSTPGRGWRDPVPVVDVLRAAIAEVEDYVRVDVVSESLDLVAGNAVNDIIHLVAELVENATVFSPPNTRIEVRADRVGTGLVAEIEDRGLGLSDEELADINRRLARPPEFDLANSEQLGLFVVSTLAARHSIKVSLRQSAYGGTTAILVLPFGVIVREGEEEGGSRGDWPGDRQSGGMPALPAGTNGYEHESYANGADDLSPFGATGRHRLSAAATGRRADTSEFPRSGDHPEWSAPRTSPRAPWEYGQPDPPAPAEPADPTPPWDAATPWPQAFRDGPARQDAARTSGPGSRNVESPAPGPQRETEGASGSHLGMPIRVPQASLAPQLQSQRDTNANTVVREGFDVDERSPEATRNMMIKMQQGWQRGRVDDLDDPDDDPAMGTDR